MGYCFATQDVLDQVEMKAKKRSVLLKFEKDYPSIKVNGDRDKIKCYDQFNC